LSNYSDHYQTLGIRMDAPDVVVKAAYKALSLKHHPDRGGNPEMMAAINAAYDVISNPAKRQEYDLSLSCKNKLHPSNKRAESLSKIHKLIDAADTFDRRHGKEIAFILLGLIILIYNLF
jgi:curved DNA-binding protein CbpA